MFNSFQYEAFRDEKIKKNGKEKHVKNVEKEKQSL